MAGLSFETARTIAIVAGVAFIGLGVVSTILLKTIAQKIALAAIFGLLALLVWTQRSALESCVDTVRGAVVAVETDSTCTFFGFDVPVPSR